MLNSTHPDDERLSALASHDEETGADADLRAHVDGCARCARIVTELGALRASLAELPDVPPSRPLRLVPPVAEPRTGASVGGWARRLFAPALTAGAALAMVGLVGTAAPALQGMAGGQDAAMPALDQPDAEPGADAAGEERDGSRLMTATDAPAAAGEDAADAHDDDLSGLEPESDERRGPETAATRDLPAERSPWPMVLFTGVALVITALLLRWILVPRAG